MIAQFCISCFLQPTKKATEMAQAELADYSQFGEPFSVALSVATTLESLATKLDVQGSSLHVDQAVSATQAKHYVQQNESEREIPAKPLPQPEYR